MVNERRMICPAACRRRWSFGLGPLAGGLDDQHAVLLHVIITVRLQERVQDGARGLVLDAARHLSPHLGAHGEADAGGVVQQAQGLGSSMSLTRTVTTVSRPLNSVSFENPVSAGLGASGLEAVWAEPLSAGWGASGFGLTWERPLSTGLGVSCWTCAPQTPAQIASTTMFIVARTPRAGRRRRTACALTSHVRTSSGSFHSCQKRQITWSSLLRVTIVVHGDESESRSADCLTGLIEFALEKRSARGRCRP